MAVTKCPGCGAAAPEDSNFCPECGRSLGSMERPRQPSAGGGWVEFIDRAWDFFASTRVAVWLIVLLAVASIAGSLVEQEHLYQDWRPPEMYYPARYGEFWGPLYMALGLTHAYSSAWYAGLTLMVVISLIICSLHRLVPLHRMLTRPQVWKLPHFIERQDVTGESGEDLDAMAAKLRKRGYKVVRDRECLYADRGRLSRYGPYIIHIGLLIVAFAGIGKAVPGWNETRDVWIPDGQTVKVPGTDFAITSRKFTMELHPNGAPARFATDAAIVRNGQEVLTQTIEVNHPLAYEGWDIYQASWREEPGIAEVSVVTADGKPVRTLQVDLRQPEAEYTVDDRVKLVVQSYYHDFLVDPASGQPTNGSFEVKNPALLGEFVNQAEGKALGRVALMILGQGSSFYEGAYGLKVDQVHTRWYTALKLHKDKTVPIMYAGLFVVMLGMVITFFLFHWQIWVRQESGRLMLGARAYKNKFGLKQEVKRLLGIPIGEGTTT
ncbi:MAG TPA: cytochrome c biogenesis protein ResB [Symbiobacteriaceae bacterium]|nr:cytochrome c biogenesis protein ResB [Symbiobacteriaceae bacterium]